MGTGIDDTISEHLNFGYLNSFILFGSIFILSGILYYFKIINGVLAFWIAFIVTRPIGASLGDLFIQPHANGWLGISVAVINIVFFVVIIAAVIYLTIDSVKNRNKENLVEI